MINASSFDKKLFDKAKIIIEIQKHLSNLTKENINFILEQILKKKEIIGTEVGVSILTKCFNDIVNSRPKNIEIIIDLINLIKTSQISNSKFSLFSTKVVEIIHTKDKLTSSDMFYLKLLYKNKIISFNLILKEIRLLLSMKDEKCVSRRYPESYISNRISKITRWFYFEIDNSKYDLIGDDKIMKEISKMDKNVIKKMMKTGYSLDHIAEVIRNDDIDSFIFIVSQKGNEFNYNQTIINIRYERCDLLTQGSSLIEYAAFFNSIKIFKYLFLNKAYFDYTLLDYAICGGSIEIIHILEQNGYDIRESIKSSIKYFQNDIFSYIIDKYPTENNNINVIHFIFNDKDDEDFDLDEKDEYFESNFEKYVSCNRNKYMYYFTKRDFDINEEYSFKKYYVKTEEILDTDYNYNFDKIFSTIVESNNILPLFILFTKGISINARNEDSMKTILHYAIKEGNYFLTKLLLSCDAVDPFLHDKNEESPILYSIKYNRESIFFEIKEKMENCCSVMEIDYFKMVQSSQICKSEKIIDYFEKNWIFNIDFFFESLKYLPFSFFKYTFEISLDEFFVTKQYHLFFLLAIHALMEESLNFSKTYYLSDPADEITLKKNGDIYALFSTNHDNIFEYSKYLNDKSFWKFSNDGKLLEMSRNNNNITIVIKSDNNEEEEESNINDIKKKKKKKVNSKPSIRI